jgi:RNA polymerase sigma factor for flagellar operon FliA
MTEGARTDSTDDSGELGRLWTEYRRNRDAETRNRLIEHHLPLCRRIAAGLYAQRGVVEAEFADYLQLATLGMIEALDRFDLERGVPFEAFARLRIRGAVLNSLASMSEKYQQAGLRKRLRREELESLKETREEEAHPRRSSDAFSRMAGLAVGLALGQLLEGSRMLQVEGQTDTYRHEFYDSLEEKRLRETLLCLVEALPERERRVVELHYFQCLEFKDIAALLGLSRGRISQVHRNALQLLKEAHGATTRLDASF